ncbi:MAG: CHAT domain-containing protein [Magnetospirillum sp.]|nr:CHAT domain-containing protein [Magnetospirillum sp.]
MKPVWRLAVCGLAVALAGCQAMGGGPSFETPVGTALSGEACRAVPNRVQPDLREIFCANSPRVYGSAQALSELRNVPQEPDARRAFLARRFETSAPIRTLGLRAACKSPEWVGTDTNLMVAACSLKDGGWPLVAAAIVSGNRLAVAEGQPAALPALVEAMRLSLGAAAPGPFDVAILKNHLEATFGAAVAGSDSVGGYQDLVELARLYNSVGNNAGAEAAYRRALALQTAALGPDHPGTGTTMSSLALEVSAQGRFEEADALFQRAEALILRSPDPGEYPRLQTFLALHAANQRQYERALASARDTIQRRRALIETLGGGIPASLDAGGGGSIFGSAVVLQAELAHALLFASSMALETGDLAGAESAALEARRIIDSIPGLPPWWQPRALSQLGQVLGARGDFVNAERLLAASAQQTLRVFGGGWPVAQSLMALAREQSNDGRYAAAIDNYRDAFRIVLAQVPVRTLNFAQVRPFLEAADAQAKRDPAAAGALHAEMFAVAQLMRDGTAGRAVARTAQRLARDDARLAPVVAAHEDALRSRDRLGLDLAGELGKPTALRDAARVAKLRADLAAATAKAAALEADIELAAPGFSRLTSPQPVAPDELRAALGPREALVFYLTGPDGAFAFLVRRDGIQAARLASDEEQLADQVRILRNAFEIRGRSDVAPFDVALSHRLYRTLLGPFETALAEVDQLFVVANGALASLPFAVLATQPPQQAAVAAGDYRQTAWLARRIATASPPSVRAFLNLRTLAARPAAPEPFFALANPDFGNPNSGGAPQGSGAANGLGALADACRSDGAVPAAMIRALAPLPETADEVRRVAASLNAGPNAFLLGANATAANLRRQQLERYRVLYFATHGLLPGELRCQAQPGLALSAPAGDVADPAEDGLLEASEIAAMRLDADLVVLSACNTAASGERLGGESLSGLAEAFFFAGARGLLVTHWQVPSQQTVQLTTGMFDRLGGNTRGGIARALAASQMALADQAASAHPFFWGAFVLQGDGAAALSAETLPVARNPS